MRKAKYPVFIFIAVAIIASSFVIGRNSASQSAGAVSTAAATPAKVTAYYLDIGASESIGFQPTGIAGHNGERTDTGYANDLVERESLKGVALDLEQIGCPGDTVQSLLDTTTSDACYQAPETQLTKAEAYLTAHHSDQVLVTIDLGFNDMRPCMEEDPINQSCYLDGVTAVQKDLPIILNDLKAKAGPGVHFIGLDYTDPYLGYYLDGAGGPARATATLADMSQFDSIITKVYTSHGVPVADVPAVFDTADNQMVTVDNVGTIPENVEEACQLTWFCYGAPFGPDDHPNNAGYSLIAEAIEKVLPKSW